MAMADADALNYERRLSALEERSNSQATKEDLALLREDLANLKTELIKWFIGTQIVLAALIIYLLQ
ncbi:MAG: hypothetical protein OXE46_00905 [Chloroflexi bacterium]|nr:hypothetical protein [Chloroflexota bacterium]